MKINDQMGPLKFIIAGYEHSGTTMLSEIFRQVPHLDSGFECGFLLTRKPQDFIGFEPFYGHLSSGWGLSEVALNQICDSADWGVAYQRLLDHSTKVADDTTSLFDKTPRYLQKIDTILDTYENLKSIILVRDFRSLIYSTFKRSNQEIEEWMEHSYPKSVRFMNKYIDAHQRLIASPNGTRSYLLRYEDLCLNTRTACEGVFEFLGMECSDSYLEFPDPKFSNVYGTGVDKQYVFQFHDAFDDSIQERIRKDFDRRKDWFFDS